MVQFEKESAQAAGRSAGTGRTKDEGWELLRRAGFHTLHEGAVDSPVPIPSRLEKSGREMAWPIIIDEKLRHEGLVY